MLAIAAALPAAASLPTRLSAGTASSTTSPSPAVRGHGQWCHKHDGDGLRINDVHSVSHDVHV